MQRPNVVLIVFDTARADVLEPYGAGVGASPAVNDLASRGWAAPRMYSTSNWTLPAHASMFTGLMPRALGLGVFPNPPQEVLQLWKERMLPAVLRRVGYATCAVSANPWISRGRGFDAGFDRFELVPHTRRHGPDRGKRERIRWMVESALARLDDGMSAISSRLDDWLDSIDRPFFCFVNLMECHSPAFPPRPYNDLSIRQRVRAAGEVRRYTWHRGALDVSLGRTTVPSPTMARLRHLYARAVLSMDGWLERFLDGLQRRKLLDDTIVIVTSDHGENLGEQGLLGHGIGLADRLIRVPLVMAGPSIPRAPSLSNLTAVPGLIAEAIDLEDHPWVGAHDTDVVIAESDGLRAIGEEAFAQVVASWGLDAATAADVTELTRCATDGRFKLVRRGGVDRLFETASDPLESSDRTTSDPEVAANLAAVLDRASAEEDAYVATLPSPGGVVPPDEEETADLEERMRTLGYL